MMIRLIGILMMMGVLVGMSGCGKERKVWSETYENGKKKEEYQYYNHPENNRRIKDGWYNSYHENYGYNEIGTYKDDVRDGEWTFFIDERWSDLEDKEVKGIYKDGKKWSGEFVQYYDSGTVAWELKYADGKREGSWVAYYDTKLRRVAKRITYVDGKKEFEADFRSPSDVKHLR